MAMQEGDDEDALRRAQEYDALRSFYGEDVKIMSSADNPSSFSPLSSLSSPPSSSSVVVPGGDNNGNSNGNSNTSETCCDVVPQEAAVAAAANGPWVIRIDPRGIFLEIHPPPSYPSSSVPPTPVLRAEPPWLVHASKRDDVISELLDMHAADTEVGILWAEHCRSVFSVEEEDAAANHPSAAGEDSDLGGNDDNDEPNVPEDDENQEEDNQEDKSIRTFVPPTARYNQPIRHFKRCVIEDDAAHGRPIHRGKPFHPPKSGPSETMIAHVAQVESVEQVDWVLAKLLFGDKRVARATHNMIAYRFRCPRKNCTVSDHDDDGEKGAGMKLAALLELSRASNVMVVVSRWFGGTLLGPARFKYIANTARDALVEAGFIQ